MLATRSPLWNVHGHFRSEVRAVTVVVKVRMAGPSVRLGMGAALICGAYLACCIISNVPGAPRLCEEQERLGSVYRAALWELVAATEVLRLAQRGSAFQDALDKTQKARTRYDSARLAWQDHRRLHACSEPTRRPPKITKAGAALKLDSPPADAIGRRRAWMSPHSLLLFFGTMSCSPQAESCCGG
jgi:hypothetical protein